MASFEEHCRDCEHLLGNRWEEVNRFLDSEFKRFGPLHRFRYHHTRGVKEVVERYGVEAGKAAIVHILKDCGHIPTARMWEEQEVDTLGMLNTRTVEGWSYFNGAWDSEGFIKKAKEEIAAYDNRTRTPQSASRDSDD